MAHNAKYGYNLDCVILEQQNLQFNILIVASRKTQSRYLLQHLSVKNIHRESIGLDWMSVGPVSKQ